MKDNNTQPCAITVLVDEILLNFKRESASESDYRYLLPHKEEYERTISDITSHFGDKDSRSLKVLEIGAFFGVVSFGLKTLDFQVTATDIPEYALSPYFQDRYQNEGIPLVACNLSSRTELS